MSNLVIGIISALLSALFFPLVVRAWEKNLTSKETFSERLSKIIFIEEDLNKDGVSMLDTSEQSSVHQIIQLVESIHQESYLFHKYFSVSNKLVLNEFLKRTQDVSDVTEDDHRTISDEDSYEHQHLSNEFIESMSNAAKEALNNLKIWNHKLLVKHLLAKLRII